jgi:RNA recognition motif-containing protein
LVSKFLIKGKLARDTRERDLEKLCREFGRIRDVRLLQGFGFAEFDSSRDAEDCIKEMDGAKFLGQRFHRIYIELL